MYTTKPLSLFKSHRDDAAAEPPPEGPNPGYLVVKSTSDDEDDETMCWCATGRVLSLPFPQNRVPRVEHGDDDETVVFVPVAGQPLASNRYHVIIATGKHKGLVRACPREEDVTTCCLFCRCVPDAAPRPFDPADVYQQIEVVQHRRGSFTARAVAAGGSPPTIYGFKYWNVYESKSKKMDLGGLGEARGLDAGLRSRQLAAGAPVGKWYCPFFLIREHGVPPRKQVGRSAFYEVVLEQRWEPVRFTFTHGDSSMLASNKKVLIGGSVEAKPEAAGNSSRRGDAYVWFVAAAGERVGVCTTVWERMLWEQSRGGWVDEEQEEAGSVADGLVLVETFVVKRMDGTVVVAFDFVHRNKVKPEQVV